jgi:hypothetical protein
VCGVIVSLFHGDDATRGPHGSGETKGEGTGSSSRFEDGHPGSDVGVDEDGPQVLRVDDLGSAFHLQDEVGEAGAKQEETGVSAGCDPRAVVGTDEPIVRHRPVVELESPPGLEFKEEVSSLAVDQKGGIPLGEWHQKMDMAATASERIIPMTTTQTTTCTTFLFFTMF